MMPWLRKIGFLVSLLLLSNLISAQVDSLSARVNSADKSTVVYNNLLYGHIIIHGNGWGFGMDYARNITAFKARLFEVELVGMKHPKEVKSYNPSSNFQNGKSYVYGKLNTFTIIRPMIGIHKILNDKIRKSGVMIGYNWEVGPAIGLTKPVYLEVGEPQTSGFHSTIERYDPSVHNSSNILGRASWFKGLDKMQLRPGLSAKFSLFFEFSSEKDGYKAIEVGSSLDAFTEKIPIMLTDYNKQFFLNFFIALELGKKYNRQK